MKRTEEMKAIYNKGKSSVKQVVKTLKNYIKIVKLVKKCNVIDELIQIACVLAELDSEREELIDEIIPL